MSNQPKITAGDITFACGIIAAEPKAYAPHRPLPTTPARRRQAILAAGRDALANVLCQRAGIKRSQLTKAIRAGYGFEPYWEGINQLGAHALGIWEE